MKDRKAILVDVDGTLANCEHRIGYVRTKPKNWKKFFEESKHDPVYPDIVWLVKTLHAAGHVILIVTARSENERKMTETWLKDVAGLHETYHRLYMRETNDPRDDAVVKSELLEQIYNDGYTPFMVLDDRNNVVKMWREQGLTCLQVRPGDF